MKLQRPDEQSKTLSLLLPRIEGMEWPCKNYNRHKTAQGQETNPIHAG